MKNFVSEGTYIDVTLAGTVSSGDGQLFGSMFGVASKAGVSGDIIALAVEGVFDLPKAATVTPGVGAKVYWDNSAKNVTTVTTSNTLIGVAVVAALAGDATVRVRLNESFS